MADHDSVLVITGGDLPGLIAIATESIRADRASRPASSVQVWIPGFRDPTLIMRRRAVRAQAEIFNSSFVEPQDTGLLLGTPDGPSISLMLIAGARVALQRGCDRLVWPVHAGSHQRDLDRLARGADRALLVSRLISLDSPEVGIEALEVQTPFLDMDDGDIADLALDLAVPVGACWWFDQSQDEDANSRATPDADQERTRWSAVLTERGWTPSDAHAHS